MKPRSKKTIDAIDYMRRNPLATPKEVAKRYKITLAYVYKLLKEARALGPIAELEAPAPKLVNLTAFGDGPTKAVALEPVPVQRGYTPAFGHFLSNATLAQALKNVITDHAADTNKRMPDYVWESLDQICTKMARIVNGDSYHLDNWTSIASYASLVVEEIESANREAASKAEEANINY